MSEPYELSATEESALNKALLRSAKNVCPHCSGEKELFCFWDGKDDAGKPIHGAGLKPCPMCKGTGWISAEHYSRWVLGRAQREQRIANHRTLHEEAERLGITAAQLSAIENGR